MNTPLIETVDLKKYFKTPKGMLHAVDGVNLRIDKGHTLGVVGESGCGKTTLGRVMLNLTPASSGEVLFEGENLVKKGRAGLKQMRREMQLIFQDPYSSLNPRLTVSEIIAEPLIVNHVYSSRAELNEHVEAVMKTVGLAPQMFNTYPHELDGGRRQRVGIARALALNPKFVVCDEPVSSLDVSIQAQILNLLMDLQDELGLTYMFITHDLSVVKHISDEIVVMYLGQYIEKAPADELFRSPLHPYTQALLEAVPVIRTAGERVKREVIKGEITSPVNPKPGCRFAPRCPYRTEACLEKDIPLKEVAPGHFVACLRY